ncbi:hypothetical protein D3OALGA1CA_3430 [Olavius algarvensis associated proteobacterium Delta 3]|nr:hypothetical protein D3OALGA1CA_3430 [Olavius algarvensis associated proteobacterium Delta 3]CAB5162716.1 hypothetical protein D3OALGB2SA_5533 [Olavius algarvensis associated proteobacterium Delta 3]
MVATGAYNRDIGTLSGVYIPAILLPTGKSILVEIHPYSNCQKSIPTEHIFDNDDKRRFSGRDSYPCNLKQ